MKRILFVAPRFHTNQFYLTKRLIENDYKITFASLSKGSSESYSNLTPFILKKSIFSSNILKVGSTKFRQNFLPSIREAFELCEKNDIIIIRNLKPVYSKVYIFIAKLLNKKVFLYTQNKVYGDFSKSRKISLKILEFFGIKHYSPVLGNSEKPKAPNSEYIPFVIDPLVDVIDNKKVEFPIKLLTIGKMQSRKKIIELSNLIREFPKKYHLTVIGENSNSKHNLYYKELVGQIDNYSNIEVLTNLKYLEVLKRMKTMDGFILASIEEPAAFSILEAMASGIFVINNTENGTHSYIKDNGYVYKDIESLSDLKTILEKITLEQIPDMKSISLELIKENHNVNRFIEIINK